VQDEGLAGLERLTAAAVQDLVDDRPGVFVRGDRPGDVPRGVPGLDEVVYDRRGALGSREG
jgi:hypothetical protein